MIDNPTIVNIAEKHGKNTGKGSNNPEADGIAEMLLSAFDVHKN